MFLDRFVLRLPYRSQKELVEFLEIFRINDLASQEFEFAEKKVKKGDRLLDVTEKEILLLSEEKYDLGEKFFYEQEYD